MLAGGGRLLYVVPFPLLTVLFLVLALALVLVLVVVFVLHSKQLYRLFCSGADTAASDSSIGSSRQASHWKSRRDIVSHKNDHRSRFNGRVKDIHIRYDKNFMYIQ